MMDQISVYIHWPYCLSLCPYCDFNSHLSQSINDSSWLAAYVRELQYFSRKLQNKKIKSIFFGGGTPSLMSSKLVEGVINAIAQIASVSSSTEITLEANPTSFEAQKFREFRAAGINRVSLGIQSLKDTSLKALGRKHNALEAIEAIKTAAKLFDRYSFDLMYALPNQTPKEWKQELESAMQLAGGHISLYQLTIEKGTPFFKLHQDGSLVIPTSDIAADMYELTNEYLVKHNYSGYEISNYSVAGDECLHNLCYWNYDEYLGIGPGAHSRLYDNDARIAVMMIHNPDRWLLAVENHGVGIQNTISLTSKEIVSEALMMSSRLKSGISSQHFYQKTNQSLMSSLNKELVEQYQKMGLVDYDSKHFRLTDKGLLLHSYIIPRILL